MNCKLTVGLNIRKHIKVHYVFDFTSESADLTSERSNSKYWINEDVGKSTNNRYHSSTPCMAATFQIFIHNCLITCSFGFCLRVNILGLRSRDFIKLIMSYIFLFLIVYKLVYIDRRSVRLRQQYEFELHANATNALMIN